MNDTEQIVGLLKSIEIELKELRKETSNNALTREKFLEELKDVNNNLVYVRGRLTDFNSTLNDINNSLN
jgi:cysteine sulfinate desulfinase/cysteine desulfurase-like protein